MTSIQNILKLTEKALINILLIKNRPLYYNIVKNSSAP
jgi:hypothetical protein